MEEILQLIEGFFPFLIGFQPSFWWCRISQPSTAWTTWDFWSLHLRLQKNILGNSFWQYGTQKKCVRGSVRNREFQTTRCLTKTLWGTGCNRERGETCEAKEVDRMIGWDFGKLPGPFLVPKSAYLSMLVREQDRRKLWKKQWRLVIRLKNNPQTIYIVHSISIRSVSSNFQGYLQGSPENVCKMSMVHN